ncbi:MAG: hypothetical protein ACLQBL_16590 [Polyangiaceae bacterium]
MIRRIALVVCALAVVPLAQCTNNGPTTPPASGVIGPGGGALASSDYVFEILIPAGALSTDVNFTISAVNTPGSGAVAPAYSITPNQTFSAPVVLSFTEEAISGTSFNDPSDYRVSGFASSTNAWTELANPTFDDLAGTVEGTTMVLSADAYSVVVPTGTECVAITESCAGDDAGCAPSCGPEIPGKCSTYAGSVTQACTVNAASTAISVNCCYPTGAPVCFTELEPNGCGSPCSQYPGSMATSCVPNVGPPLNNASTGGASVSTCCYPPGSLVDGGIVNLADAAVGTDGSSGDAAGNGDAAGSGDAGADASSDAGPGADAGTDSGAVDAGDDGG